MISLASPGYEPRSVPQSQMPYLRRRCARRASCSPTTRCSASRRCPTSIAAVSGQPPNADDEAGCPTFAEFPRTANASANGVVQRRRLRLPGRNADPRRPARRAAAHLARLHGGDGRRDRQPDNCVYPGPDEADTAEPGGYAASHNPFVYFHSLLDLGDCAANDVPLDQLSGGPAQGRHDAELLLHRAEALQRRRTGQCPAGATDGPASADAFLSTWVPKILASPAYKADGLLIVTFAAGEPAGPAPEGTPSRPPIRCRSAPCCSPRSSPRAPPTPSHTTPTRSLRSSEDLFGLDPLGLAAAAKTKSFAPSLLEENGGD